MEAIVGGVSATATYPEAALLNMTSTAGLGYACSATLIAPKVVLTAGHCVDGMASWQVYVGTNLRTSTHGETYDWAENGASTVNPAHHDIGLVYLDQAITLASYPTLATAKVANGTSALNVGRILNGTLTNSLYDAAVTVSDATSVGYPLDYTGNDVIEHGDSGGPVFVNGTHNLIAVNSGAGGGTEVLARVDLLSAWIQQKIAANGGTATPAPTPTPAPTTTTPAPAPTPTPAPTTPAPSSACTQEAESNDSFAKANTATTAECGSLSTATDVDWFTYSAPVGTNTISLSATSDAVMTLGYVSRGACVVSLTGAKSAKITVSGGPLTVCVEVTSPKKATQTYRITR